MGSSTLLQARRAHAKDLRTLPVTEVCELGDWLTKYRRLELEPTSSAPPLTDSRLLLDVLVRSSREYESDLGIFGVED